jgi:hypothetical protein
MAKVQPPGTSLTLVVQIPIVPETNKSTRIFAKIWLARFVQRVLTYRLHNRDIVVSFHDGFGKESAKYKQCTIEEDHEACNGWPREESGCAVNLQQWVGQL